MTHRSTIRPTRRQAALGLTALGALWLSACTGGDSGSDDAAADPADGAGTDGAGADGGSGDESDGDDDQGQASTAEVGTSTAVDPADALATLSYPIPTTDIEGTMTVGLHHLRVRGETMELLLTFTPEFTGNETHNLYQLHENNGNNLWPILFDRENLTQYDVLESGATRWFTEDQAFELASGDTQPFWANFAVPVDDIDVIDVGISTGPYFEDVPIDRSSAEASGGAGDADGEE